MQPQLNCRHLDNENDRNNNKQMTPEGDNIFLPHPSLSFKASVSLS
jgi:hypothetical protein